MSFVTFTTRDGTAWTPKYMVSIAVDLCIGCGRCFKVCTAGVLKLMGVEEDGAFCDPFDDDNEDMVRKVMVVEKAGACIGCEACATVCGTKAQKHEAIPA